MKNDTSIEVKALNASIQEGNKVEFIVRNLSLSGQTEYSISIAEVDSDYTDFVLSAGGQLNIVEDSILVDCTATSQLSKGMYLLTELDFFNITPQGPTNRIHLTNEHFGHCVFEIKSPSSPSKTQLELIRKYQEILELREREFLKGFGENPSNKCMQEYLVLVFVKDCLVTRRMRLGQYEVIPFEGLACNDELNLIQRFLPNAGLSRLTNTEDTLSRAQRGQPTVVVHFQRVIAQSVQIAGQMVEQEVQILGALLALHRGSYPSIFGSVIVDLATKQICFKIVTPSYTGNLLGGFISGEDPRLIRDQRNKVRNDDRLQLYLSLYRESLLEERVEFAYFRYWNLLETIARSKGYIGQALRDWQGNIVKNARGQDRYIQDDALELVFELIRQTFVPKCLSEQSLSFGLEQGSISQLIPIWYRHRNCVVHSGGCFPNDSNHCDRTKDNYINCKKAHDEIVTDRGIRNMFTDRYLGTIQETVKIVISAELS